MLVPRYWGLPGNPYPSITIRSMKKIVRKVSMWLNEWRPEVIICHTLWPVAELASRLAKQWNIPWLSVVHGHDFDIGLADGNTKSQSIRLAKSATCLVTVSTRLAQIAHSHGIVNPEIIRCHTAVEDEWLTAAKSWRGRWRKEKLDLSLIHI